MNGSPLDWATSDAVPFRELNDLPLGMTAHITFPAWGDRPATLHPGMIEAIRKDLGFDGLLMTDDISMQALNGDVNWAYVGVSLAAIVVLGVANVVLFLRRDIAVNGILRLPKLRLRGSS